MHGAGHTGYGGSRCERLRDGDFRESERRVVRAYAPYSVMRACKRRRVGPYWVSSEAFASLRTYIDLDFDGLQQSVVQALGGAGVRVDTHSFENSIHDVASADDALTLLCHLGYLCYDAETRTARVPNEEVRAELRQAVAQSRHAEVARIEKCCYCDLLVWCRGCRAVGVNATGNLQAADPMCWK